MMFSLHAEPLTLLLHIRPPEEGAEFTGVARSGNALVCGVFGGMWIWDLEGKLLHEVVMPECLAMTVRPFKQLVLCVAEKRGDSEEPDAAAAAESAQPPAAGPKALSMYRVGLLDPLTGQRLLSVEAGFAPKSGLLPVMSLGSMVLVRHTAQDLLALDLSRPHEPRVLINEFYWPGDTSGSSVICGDALVVYSERVEAGRSRLRVYRPLHRAWGQVRRHMAAAASSV
jgi:hypothetical protein